MAGNLRRLPLSITTAANGVVTSYVVGPNSEGVTGNIVSIQYVKDVSTPYSNGVSVTITGEQTGLAIWSGANVNASVTVYPVAAATLIGGNASTLTEVPVRIVGERISVAIASGGNAKVGQFYVIME